MSALIGCQRGPSNNSPHDAAEVWADRSGITLNLFSGNGTDATRDGTARRFDAIAARNLAALLVRGADEHERMQRRLHEADPG